MSWSKQDPPRFDCYANAAQDEPMFILLARDAGAPALVRRWADERAASGEDPAKVADARACADSMEAWRAVNRPNRQELPGRDVKPVPSYQPPAGERRSDRAPEF